MELNAHTPNRQQLKCTEVGLMMKYFRWAHMWLQAEFVEFSLCQALEYSKVLSLKDSDPRFDNPTTAKYDCFSLRSKTLHKLFGILLKE